MTDELLTTRQLANRFGLSPITLQQWRAHAEGPPFIKSGPRVYYRLDDVLAFERGKLEQLMARILASDRPLAVARTMVNAADLRIKKGRPVKPDNATGAAGDAARLPLTKAPPPPSFPVDRQTDESAPNPRNLT